MEIKDISWLVTEEEYRKDIAYSYSTLSRYSREGFDNLDKLFDKVSSPSLLFGSVVDTLVTEPHRFKDIYVVQELPDVGESIEQIIRELFEKYKTTSFDNIPEHSIHEACDNASYYNNPKYHTYRIKLIKEKGKNLYEILRSVGDKTIITPKLYKDAEECKIALANSYARNFIFEDIFNDNIKIYPQLKFKSTYKDIPVRCMFDFIVQDKERKLLIPVDLKTSYKSSYKFKDSFIKWKYFVQGKLYSYILQENIKNHPYFKDYKIAPYFFVVISNSDKVPMVWRYKDNFNTLYPNNEKPWEELLEELDYYLKNKPKVPKEYNLETYNDLEFDYGTD